MEVKLWLWLKDDTQDCRVRIMQLGITAVHVLRAWDKGLIYAPTWKK